MSQVDAVLALLKERPEGITAMDALRECGTMRLAARVSDLRDRGYIITTYTVRRGRSNVALYKLREKAPVAA